MSEIEMGAAEGWYPGKKVRCAKSKIFFWVTLEKIVVSIQSPETIRCSEVMWLSSEQENEVYKHTIINDPLVGKNVTSFDLHGFRNSVSNFIGYWNATKLFGGWSVLPCCGFWENQ